MKLVVVQLAPDSGRGPKGAQHQAAFAKAKDFGLTLKAMHPESNDSVLSRWFRAEVDNAKAEEFATTLRNLPGVTAAYVKPRPSAP